jgi:predicted MPP superfamily phosphohydrolase
MQKRPTHDRRRRPRLADPIHRMTTRWRSGGVEQYPLGKDETHRTLKRMGSAFEITQHNIRLEILPEAFEGFRIIQLTDIHHGVFLPGGNHDFRVGADEITESLERAGISVLRNAHTRLRRRGQSLYLAGIDDWNYRPDLPRAIRGIPKNSSTVLLSHNPAIIQAAAQEKIGLVLSGHTHGGQVNLPFLGNIWGRSPEQLQFKVGWGRLGHTQIYVSRGIGTIVLPLRFRCPAEIPQLSLEALHSAA